MNELQWKHSPTPSEQAIIALHRDIFGEKPIAPWHKPFLSLLLQRGISTAQQAKAFLRPSLAQLHNPFLMKGLGQATERIIRAMAQGERMLIFGDYDVDGACAVAMMYLFLRQLHPQVSYYIPDRYAEGYGVSEKGIRYAADNDCSLIITLDCGIKSVKEIRLAKELGIDVIVCDHHLPDPNHLPEAYAILNPKQPDCPYPFKELCGCGVGWKLAHGISEQMELDASYYECFLPLVATATAADIVPVVGENRILLCEGLERINEQHSWANMPALNRLLQYNKPPFTMTDLVFGIAPRINAAGRMQHASYVVDLLISQELLPPQELQSAQEQMAQHINLLNQQRKLTDEQITQQALAQIEKEQMQAGYTTVVFQQDWHKGVIGIVASRLIEHYHRPTIVFTQSAGVYVGSGRSVSGFDLHHALHACQEHLIQYGGHQAAAGLTLLPEQFQAFKNRFEEVVKNSIQPQALHPSLTINHTIGLESITDKLVENIERLSPFGPENPTPVFLSQNIHIRNPKKIGANGTHLKMQAYCPLTHKEFACVGFSLGFWGDEITAEKTYNIAYSIDKNHWNGTTSTQLRVRDIRET